MTGQIATSKAGHDKDTIYVIVNEDSEYFYLCDGRGKTPEKPKKKRKKHVQLIYAFAQDSIRTRLEAGDKVYPEEIRMTIKQYNMRKTNKM